MTASDQHVTLAKTFVNRFCTGNVEGLNNLLADDVAFSGPILTCNTKRDYLAALRRDPPQAGRAVILSITRAEDAVAIFYDYLLPDVTMRVAHLFVFKGGLISQMTVLFHRTTEQVAPNTMLQRADTPQHP